MFSSSLSRPSPHRLPIPVSDEEHEKTLSEKQRKISIEYSPFLFEQQLIDTPINAFDILTILLLKIVSLLSNETFAVFGLSWIFKYRPSEWESA